MIAREDRGTPLEDRVLRLVSELDPYSLEPGGPDGVPADEYVVEAVPIADLLSHGHITAVQIDAVWLEWFSEPLTDVVGEDRARELVTALNGLVLSRE